MNNADYKLSPADKNEKRFNLTPHFYSTAAVLIGGLAAVISTPAYADLNTSVTGFKSIVGDVKQVINSANNSVDITAAGNRSIAEWTKLNTKAWEKINFILPDNKATLLGRITGAGSTSILGSVALPHGGHVFLVNPAGFIIGKNAMVDTGSLVFSKYDIDPQKFYKEGLVQLRKAGMKPSDSVVFAYPADGDKFSNGATVYLNEDGGLTAVQDTLEDYTSAAGETNTYSSNVNTTAKQLQPITDAEKLLWDQVVQPEVEEPTIPTAPNAQNPKIDVEANSNNPTVVPVKPTTSATAVPESEKPLAKVEKPTSATPDLDTPDYTSASSHTDDMQQAIQVKDNVLYLEAEQEFQIIDSGNNLISYKVVAHDDPIALTTINAKADHGEQSFADLVANVNQHTSATDKLYTTADNQVVLGEDKPAPTVVKAKPKSRVAHKRVRPRVTAVAVKPTPAPAPTSKVIAKPAPEASQAQAQAQQQTAEQQQRAEQIKEIKQASSSIEKSITEYTAGKKLSQTIKNEPIPNAIFKLRQRARQLQQQRKYQQQEDSSERTPTPADHNTSTSADASASKVISFDYSTDLAEVVHKVKKS